jgi:xylulokinase
MAHQYILSIDLGTSSTKTTLWNEHGIRIAEATSANEIHRPDPLKAEIDGNHWWLGVAKSARQVVSHASIHPDQIAGIGIDGMGWAFIPVDKNVNPLNPVMIWMDRRAGKETEWLKHLPESNRLIDLAANPIDEAYSTPKMIWLRNNRPEIFEDTYQFLGATGFIVACFTGEFTCDYTQAYGYHFFDIRNKQWNVQAANAIGIPVEKMPRLCSPTEIVGTVTSKAADETGLRPGIPVIAGCLDAAIGALGAGVTKPGQTNEQGGQAGGFGISLEEVIVEPKLIFSHHVLEDQYILAAGTVGGGSLEWFRAQLGQLETSISSLTNQNPFDLLGQQASQSPPGANGLIFLPYMAGERTPLWSNEARGVFLGLSYSTSRADILRAILEGSAFAVNDNLKIAEESGVNITKFFGSGGATKSEVWCQIKADVYGKPFIVAQQQDGSEGGHSLGMFAITAYAVGLRDNIKDCVNSLLPKRKIYNPSKNNHAIYKEMFWVYRNVSRKLMDDFNDLDKIRRTIL